MVAERQRTFNDHVHVRVRESVRLLEGPPLRNAELPEGYESQPDENARGCRYIFRSNDDVAVDDRLRRQSRDGRATDVLDSQVWSLACRERCAQLCTESLEPLWPRRVVF